MLKWTYLLRFGSAVALLVPLRPGSVEQQGLKRGQNPRWNMHQYVQENPLLVDGGGRRTTFAISQCSALPCHHVFTRPAARPTRST